MILDNSINQSTEKNSSSNTKIYKNKGVAEQANIADTTILMEQKQDTNNLFLLCESKHHVNVEEATKIDLMLCPKCLFKYCLDCIMLNEIEDNSEEDVKFECEQCSFHISENDDSPFELTPLPLIKEYCFTNCSTHPKFWNIFWCHECKLTLCGVCYKNKVNKNNHINHNVIYLPNLNNLNFRNLQAAEIYHKNLKAHIISLQEQLLAKRKEINDYYTNLENCLKATESELDIYFEKCKASKKQEVQNILSKKSSDLTRTCTISVILNKIDFLNKKIAAISERINLIDNFTNHISCLQNMKPFALMNYNDIFMNDILDFLSESSNKLKIKEVEIVYPEFFKNERMEPLIEYELINEQLEIPRLEIDQKTPAYDINLL